MNSNIYSQVYDLLKKEQKLVLARTIQRQGSAPREVGSACIITEQGELIGTIGGGLLEYQVQKRAKELFSNPVTSIYKFKLSSDDLAKAGMICGGDVDIYLEPLFPENQETFLFFKSVKAYLSENKPGYLITRIKDGTRESETHTRIFIKEDGSAIGRLDDLETGQLDLKNMALPMVFEPGKDNLVFIQKIVMDPSLVIFGAGHISIFLSKLAKMVGFHITIVDDRQEFANQDRFPEADQILARPFDQAFDALSGLNNTFVVIVTRGHISDKDVLAFALKQDLKYIGMIGSRRKRNTIYESLMEQGYAKADLEKVYSPIGIEINALTPEEIAVAIIAELIKVRGAGKKLKKLM